MHGLHAISMHLCLLFVTQAIPQVYFCVALILSHWSNAIQSQRQCLLPLSALKHQ